MTKVATDFNTTNSVTSVQILVSVLTTHWLKLGGQLQCKTSMVSGRDGYLHTQTPQWPAWE
jgi:hypothetical protein